jgi:hypothetical protein
LTFEQSILQNYLSYPTSAWFSRFRESREVDYPLERYVSIDSFERNLRRIVRRARWQGAAVVLVTQPALYKPEMSSEEVARLWGRDHLCVERDDFFGKEYATPASLARALAAFNARTKAVALSEGAIFVDADAAVSKDLSNFMDDVHATAAGAKVEAETVAEAIIAARLLESGPSRTPYPSTDSTRLHKP